MSGSSTAEVNWKQHKGLTKYELEFSGPSAYWMRSSEPKKDYVPILLKCI
jgi:hypothetical protein